MMSLLQPLAEATNILCASKYPNLKPEIPIDVIILKYLFVARRELYEQSQLIFPANLIIKKNSELDLHDSLQKTSLHNFHDLESNLQDHFLVYSCQFHQEKLQDELEKYYFCGF